MTTPNMKRDKSEVRSNSSTSGINIVLNDVHEFKDLKDNEFLNKLDEEIRKTEMNVK